MTDIQLPAGKFVPPIQPVQPNPDISRVVQRTVPYQQNVSFSDTLQSRMNKMSTTQSVPQTSSSTPPLQAIPIPETMPENLTTGPKFESGLINSWQQYNTMGSSQTAAINAEPARTAAQPGMNAAMMHAKSATSVQTQASPYQNMNQYQSVSQSTQASSASQPANAEASALARGLGQAYNVSPEPLPQEAVSQEPIYVPAPEVELTAEEAAQLDALIAGQPMQQTNAANRNSKVNAKYQQNQQQNLAQQSNDSQEKKGFFKSIGSFFKNIASGLTLGVYRPDNEPAMQGMGRVVEPFKRVLWDAPKSLLLDAPMGAYHSITGSTDDRDDNGQTATVAMNQQAQQVIEAGEKTIARRRVHSYATGSKLRSARLS